MTSRPLIEMAIAASGASRLTWASNFTPSAGPEGYANTLRSPIEKVSFARQEEKDRVFGNTAPARWKLGE